MKRSIAETIERNRWRIEGKNSECSVRDDTSRIYRKKEKEDSDEKTYKLIS